MYIYAMMSLHVINKMESSFYTSRFPEIFRKQMTWIEHWKLVFLKDKILCRVHLKQIPFLEKISADKF